VNYKDEDSQTPLILACKNHSFGCVLNMEDNDIARFDVAQFVD
jgi:hypothetical protein